MLHVQEQTSELAIQLSGTFWSRQFTVIDFPVFNARGIGLFSGMLNTRGARE